MTVFVSKAGSNRNESSPFYSGYVVTLLADYFEPRRLTTAMSVFLLGAPIGIGVAFTGGGYLYGVALDFTASNQGQIIPVLGELRAWELVLLILGLSGMLMSLALLTVGSTARTLAIISILIILPHYRVLMNRIE